ncbi:hypothetical protein PCNPT3_09095 [Psychromonas sp. CNPT3]|uniref:hypothetical protein n=1 Tax=Psychromonas sp. CNPT3 TaxID=314282 RepID=UPI00006E3F7D|nr:hypothetical protein [Psychromonas sp. CNPT3]AGH81757.1 hypothetical protein PCNPT3_09095 [Psychromonas sp. CNPT3]
MPKLDFSAINKSSAKSYHAQKNMIKNIGKGRTVLCPTCQQVLTLCVSANNTTGVSCVQGCTSISLEVEA